jgi:hypothetical protein
MCLVYAMVKHEPLPARHGDDLDGDDAEGDGPSADALAESGAGAAWPDD